MQPTVEDFFAFVLERQRIWHRRHVQRLPAPWTDDAVLQTYKFCNVYRELDACTQYLLRVLDRVPNREDVLLNILFYRFFNRRSLYEELEIPPLTHGDLASLAARFEARLAAGHRIFNDAYLICPGGSKPKHRAVLEALASVDIVSLSQQLDAARTPEEAFAALQIPLAGPFLACEFWTDLAYRKYFPQGWTDDDFVNLGPGAKWGLELLFGAARPGQLAALREQQKHFLGSEWRAMAYEHACSAYPYLSITNIEGCLCEFRKYWRLKHGKGKRRYYKG